jgi:hypothetical protein
MGTVGITATEGETHTENKTEIRDGFDAASVESAPNPAKNNDDIKVEEQSLQ